MKFAEGTFCHESLLKHFIVWMLFSNRRSESYRRFRIAFAASTDLGFESTKWMLRETKSSRKWTRLSMEVSFSKPLLGSQNLWPGMQLSVKPFALVCVVRKILILPIFWFPSGLLQTGFYAVTKWRTLWILFVLFRCWLTLWLLCLENIAARKKVINLCAAKVFNCCSKLCTLLAL